MAPGELARPSDPGAGPGDEVRPGDLSVDQPVTGRARTPTSSGRLSEALDVHDEDDRSPFSAAQLSRLDEALTLATRETGLLFSLYVGRLGDARRERAEEMHASLGGSASRTVLVAVSPGERGVEVVTGEEARRRVDDQGAKLAVTSMLSSFRESDLVGGMVEGVRVLAEHAGAQRR